MEERAEKRSDVTEIDLREVFQQIKKKFWIVLIATIVAGAGTYLVTKFVITPMYQSSVMMIVNSDANTNANNPATNDSVTAAQNLVQTYSVIITSDTVLNRVINDLDLDTTYDELKDNIDVEGVENTQVMKVSVKDKSRQTSKLITRDIADIAPKVIEKSVEAGSCKVISRVSSPKKQVSPDVNKDTLIAALIGFIAAIAGITMYTVLRVKRIVDDNDVQKYTGLTVLGVIPEVNGGRK